MMRWPSETGANGLVAADARARATELCCWAVHVRTAMRGKLACLALLAGLPLVAAGQSGLGPNVGDRVRTQSEQLGPGWHEGLFNQTRTEPPCYVVLIFAPRVTQKSPMRVSAFVAVERISRLQITADPFFSSMQDWVGFPELTLPEASWRDIRITHLQSPNDRCQPAISPAPAGK